MPIERRRHFPRSSSSFTAARQAVSALPRQHSARANPNTISGILAQWPDRADTDRNVTWTRALFDALQPYASGAFLLNFLDQEEDAVIRASFGRNYNRLVELKRKYDPENFFRQNHNIKPS